METVLEVEHLIHSYNSHPAVNDMSFSVQAGEVLGLLGPNGAGKTTTVRLANGLFPPTSGSIRILGFDPVTQGSQVRRQTGVLTETPALYERLTARQNLEFFGARSGLPAALRKQRSDELLALFDLTERANDRTGTYSKGMKQRLAIARALLHQPRMLFLDEPTSGLDPEASQQVHELIAGIRQRNGQTVVLCTHNLYEAERLCDRLAIMHHGQLLALGSLDELRRQFAPGHWLEIGFLQPAPQGLSNRLSSLMGVLRVEAGAPDCWRLQVREESVTANVIDQLVLAGARLKAVVPQQESLEQIYFKLQEQAGKS
jgi:ABC-2 type transport system ATP-binding protein